MTKPAYAKTTLNEAATIPGATVGAAVALGAEDTIDLTLYAGRWVKLYSLDDGALFCFQELGDTAPLETGAVAIETAGVPDAFDAGADGVHRIIPRKTPQLRHLAQGGGGILRIVPS